MKPCCRNCAHADIRQLDSEGLYEICCKVTGPLRVFITDRALDETRDENCFDPKEASNDQGQV